MNPEQFATAELEQKAQAILKDLWKDFRLPSGLLSLQKINGQLDPRHVISDLGDIIPFALFYQQQDFVNEQLTFVLQKYPEGIMPSQTPMSGVSGLVKSYEYTDLLLGLVTAVINGSDQTKRDYLQLVTDQAVTMFRLGGGWSSIYAPQLRLSLPARDFRDGMFLELLLDVDRALQSSQYQGVAADLFQTLVTDKQWQRLHIWPAYSVGFGLNVVSKLLNKKIASSEFVKANSNTIFGLYALWDQTQDERVLSAIRASIDGCLQHFVQESGVAMAWNRKDGAHDVRLTAGFTMIELLCDGYAYSQETSWLHEAQKIADFWLGQQSTNGLFPTVPSGQTAFIDSNSDMIVALCKLTERTGDERYQTAAWKCWLGMEQSFVTHGFPLHCRLSDGQPASTVVKSKFIALFLKTYILRQHYLTGKKIYQSPKLFELLKDR